MSPVMPITHRLTKEKYPMVDFRILYTHIMYRNTVIPLLGDICNIFDNSRCEILLRAYVKMPSSA